MGLIEQKDLLWCLICEEKFTLDDIPKRYVGMTGICMACYSKMEQDASTCFGKETTEGFYGYDEATCECKEFCPDRVVCKGFIALRHG